MALHQSWILINDEGKPYESDFPGVIGGHRRGKIYGLLNCRSALKAIERGGYTRNRVFFLNEEAAKAAGYRPCAVCMPSEYAIWKINQSSKLQSR